MALRVVHLFVSGLPDSDNTEEVRPSNWNEDHVIEGVSALSETLLALETESAWRSALGVVPGTDVQTYDPLLAAIAGLSMVADRYIYGTGADEVALGTITSHGRSILDDADAAATRTTLGLVIGTDVQAYDAELAALAGLTSAANKIPYFTGSGTAGLLDFLDEDTMASNSATALASQQSIKAYVDAAVTGGVPDGDKGDIVVSSSGTVWEFDSGVVSAFARTILDDANAAAVRTTLGLAIGTDVQAYDAELAAFAALTPVASNILWYNGGGSLALATITGFGLSLIDDTTAANARVTLGLQIGSDVQAYDLELSALAGLTSAADRLPYFTGSGAAALATFTAGGRALVDSAGTADTFPYFSASNTVTLGAITSFGRSLIDDAAASNARTTLGLVIGTDVQAYDAELAQIAGLADPGVDRILFWDFSASSYDFMGVGTGLFISGTTLAAVQASTTAVGISEWATTAEWLANTGSRVLETNQLWAAGAEVTLTDAATIAVDMSTFINAVVTLGGNRTLGNPSNEKVGQSGVIRIVQDGTGSRTLAYGTDWEFAGGSAPVLSTAANDQDLLFYYVIATNRVFASLVKDIS